MQPVRGTFLQTEGNPAQSWQIQGNHEGVGSQLLEYRSLSQHRPLRPFPLWKVLYLGMVSTETWPKQGFILYLETAKHLWILLLTRPEWMIWVHSEGGICFPGQVRQRVAAPPSSRLGLGFPDLATG